MSRHPNDPNFFTLDDATRLSVDEYHARTARGERLREFTVLIEPELTDQEVRALTAATVRDEVRRAINRITGRVD